MQSTAGTSSPASAGKRWRVGDCLVDPAANRIICGAREAHLEPRSMEVLVHLLEHAGQVVSRDRLQAAIWGEVVVGDDSLTNAIIKIRKALGDDARNPRFVETIPKRGYRLLAPVEPARPPGAAPAHGTARGGPGRAGPGRRGPGRGARAALAVASLAAIALIGVFAPLPSDPPARLPRESPAPAASGGGVRVAVRPFVNLGNDSALDYLVRGLEETVVNQLTAYPELRIVHPVPGSAAAADFSLEGLVQPGPQAMRVTIRLLDAHDGTILANEQLVRPPANLLEMEKAIETRIIRTLALDIERADLARRASGYTSSAEAFDLFLRAQAALLVRGKEANRRAQALYRQAIGHDPRFARAYGGLALSLAAEYRGGWATEPAQALAGALEMARTALQIAPDLPEQYWVIGYVRTQQRDFAAAQKALRHALKLRPDYADAHALLGGIATYEGRPQESLPSLRRAIRLRPEAGYLYYLLLGRAYYFLDDCQQAEINLAEALARNPENLEARLYHAACLLHLGMAGDAEWETEEIRTLEPGFRLGRFFRSYPMADRAQIARLSADLGQLGLQ